MRTLLTAITLLLSATSSLAASPQDHAMMNHSSMDHSSMNHSSMPPSSMNPSAINSAAQTSNTSSTAPVYQSTGVVKAWTENQVTLAHAPIPALNWPAMTMRFNTHGYQGSTFSVGQAVTFSFSQSATGYDLISASAN